jgi:hypothetical protein
VQVKSFHVDVQPGPLCAAACLVHLMPRAVAGSTTLVTLRAADALGNRIQVRFCRYRFSRDLNSKATFNFSKTRIIIIHCTSLPLLLILTFYC